MHWNIYISLIFFGNLKGIWILLWININQDNLKSHCLLHGAVKWMVQIKFALKKSVFPKEWKWVQTCSSGQRGGLLRSSVPGGWPAAATLQGGLHAPERSVRGVGQDATQQWRLRGGGLWYCDRWVCCAFSITALLIVKSPDVVLYIQCSPPLTEFIFLIFLSDSHPARHLLHHL